MPWARLPSRPSFPWSAVFAHAVWLILSLGSGCERHTARRVGVQVVSVELDAPRGAPAWLGPTFEVSLGRSRLLEPTVAQDAGYRAKLSVQQVDDAVVRVDVELARPDAPAPDPVILDAHVEVERTHRSVSLEQDVPLAFDRAVAVLDAKLGLARGHTEVARRLLGGTDPELRWMAIHWVEHHRRRDLVDEVRPRLEDPDPRVAKSAVDCLGTIGSASDVAALVAAARLSDRDHTGRLYAALGRLGGPQARGFLEFAARNEDDSALAQLAQISLSRLGSEPGRPEPRLELARGHR